jgi:hypothetical protein
MNDNIYLVTFTNGLRMRVSAPSEAVCYTRVTRHRRYFGGALILSIDIVG